MRVDTPESAGSGRVRTGIRVSHVIVLLLVVTAFGDVPSIVSFGRLSGMGVLTLVQVAIVLLALTACRTYPRRLVYVLVPYAAFLLWAGVGVLWAPNTIAGLQNLSVYVLFGLIVLLTGALAAHVPSLTGRAIELGIRWIDVVALTIAAWCLIFQGLPSDENPWIIGARSFGLLGLPPMSWHVAQANAGRRHSTVFAWLWLMAIGLSLSRTATAVALFYMGIAVLLQIRMNARSLLVKAPAIAAATAIVVVVLARETPMADRLFTGDTAIEVGGVGVNVSGRSNIWSEVTNSAMNAPIVGQGVGSSIDAASKVSGVGHPHNDYLRVWHDHGFVGLGLWGAAFVAMLVVLLRIVVRSDWRSDPSAPTHLAALLALTGLLIACTTDNAIIYPFVVAPVGVLVGAGLGTRAYVAAPVRA
jgi:O-antigen ligase